jgi:VDE lipocalin domain
MIRRVARDLHVQRSVWVTTRKYIIHTCTSVFVSSCSCYKTQIFSDRLALSVSLLDRPLFTTQHRCITGCMARYGNTNLDSLLKCTVEDHECIKIAILPGGADPFGQEPRAPKATVPNFDYRSLQGSWYKVVGFNPNYDCYACQRNTFSLPATENDGDTDNSSVKLVGSSTTSSESPYLNVGVEFSMPHLLPDGTPPPPRQVRESMAVYKEDIGTSNGAGSLKGGFRSIGLNEYNTNEVMVFDQVPDSKNSLVMNKGKSNEATYSRTAHSEGEMFGLSK